MYISITDSQIVGEVEATLFSTIQQGPTSMLLILKNSGVNPITYRFQENTGAAWVDLGASGTDYNTVLAANEVKEMLVASNYAQVRMLGSASGGSNLEVALSRYSERSSGGPFPILSL